MKTYIVLIVLFLFSYNVCMIPPNTCPAPITSGFLKINCCDIYYELSGTATKGTMVFIGPFLGNHLAWPCQRNFFCAHGYRVLLIDRRGAGFSQSIPPYDTTQEVSDIDSILTLLGIVQPIVVGWSKGGGTAMLYAITFPTKLSKLVLMCTSPRFFNDPSWSFGADATQVATGEVANAAAKATNSMAPFIPWAASVLGPDNCPTTNPVQYSGAVLIGNDTILHNDPQVQGDIVNASLDFDVRSQLQFIIVPTLILYGCVDALFKPGASLFMAAHIVGSIIIGMTDKGHAMPLSAADASNQLILQFLDGPAPMSDTTCSLPVACSSCAAI